MALSAGPTPLGSNDPPVCGYGIRPSLRGATRLLVSTPLAALLWTLTVAVAGVAVALVASDHGVVAVVAGALLSVLAATTGVWLAIAVWLASPFSRSYHWQQRIERYTPQDAADASTHSILSLKSRHMHMASAIVCEVIDREGRTYTHAWRSPYGVGPLPIRRGDGPAVAYPDQFGRPEEPDAPSPTPGTYTVLWRLQPPPGDKRRVLYKTNWKVTD